MRGFYKVLLVVVAIILILMTIGAIYELTASRQDEAAFPAQGIIVETSLGKMHLCCQGEGDITVIAEAGLGDSSLEWGEVQPAIAEVTRMCAYDRPGMGWSEPVDWVLTPEEIADNLHELLVNSGEQGPFILVAHSIGGIYAREYVMRYPDEVAGLVLVDSSHDNQRNILPDYAVEAFDKYQNTVQTIGTIGGGLHPFGLPRAFRLFEGMINGDQYSDETREAILARMYQPHFYSSFVNEQKTGKLATEQDQPPQDMGEVMLIVLSQGYAVNDGSLPDEQFNELRDLNFAMQQELASLSSNSEYVVATESGHYIHHDQPELVIDAIMTLFELTSSHHTDP
jgi:pimeloyl-ACP methyl ester carboxylesterase